MLLLLSGVLTAVKYSFTLVDVSRRMEAALNIDDSHCGVVSVVGEATEKCVIVCSVSIAA